MSEQTRLPPGWMRTTVGMLADSIQYGHTASAIDDRLGPRFLRITDIQDGQVDWDSVPSCAIDADELDTYRLIANDIVFARTGATTGKSFLIKQCPEAVFASYLIRLRMSDGVFAPFIQAYFQTNDYWRQIEAGKRGIGQPNVNARVLASIQLPFAPINEQRRIVTRIEELFSLLDAGIAALRQAKTNLKNYRAAVVNAAVEGKLTAQWRAEQSSPERASRLLKRVLAERRQKWESVQLAKFAAADKSPPKNWAERYVEPAGPDISNLPDLPDSWCWVSVAQCAVDEAFSITDGPFGSNLKTEHYTSRGPRVIRLQNIGNGTFIDDDAHISRKHFQRLKKHSVKAGDVVVAILGESLPRACLVPSHVPPAIVKADCVKISPDRRLVLEQQLVAALNARSTRQRASA